MFLVPLGFLHEFQSVKLLLHLQELLSLDHVIHLLLVFFISLLKDSFRLAQGLADAIVVMRPLCVRCVREVVLVMLDLRFD